MSDLPYPRFGSGSGHFLLGSGSELKKKIVIRFQSDLNLKNKIRISSSGPLNKKNPDPAVS